MTGGGTTSAVARWRSTSARTRSKSKRGTVTSVAPEQTGTTPLTTKPMMCEKGPTASTTHHGLLL
jgi:hypothetical protein